MVLMSQPGFGHSKRCERIEAAPAAPPDPAYEPEIGFDEFHFRDREALTEHVEQRPEVDRLLVIVVGENAVRRGYDEHPMGSKAAPASSRTGVGST